MARIRTVKPELFRHEELYELEQSTGLPVRLSFIGLFTVCDREGRFRWRPRQLKLDVLPYDNIDFSRVLDALITRGFLVRYEVSGEIYGCIPSFTTHQIINNRESESILPPLQHGRRLTPEKNEQSLVGQGIENGFSRVSDACPTRHDLAQGEREREGKGNRKGKEEEYCAELSLDAGASSVPILQNEIDDNQQPAAIRTVDGSSALVAATVERDSTVIIELPTNRKGVSYPVTQKIVDDAIVLYPGVDVVQQFRNMRGWLDGNPSKRKTFGGMPKFFHAWLAKEQNNQQANKNPHQPGKVNGAGLYQQQRQYSTPVDRTINNLQSWLNEGEVYDA